MRPSALLCIAAAGATAIVALLHLDAKRHTRRKRGLKVSSSDGLLPLLNALQRHTASGEVWNNLAFDLGAGVRDSDPCFELFDSGWAGIMIDSDPAQLPRMRKRMPSSMVLKAANAA